MFWFRFIKSCFKLLIDSPEVTLSINQKEDNYIDVNYIYTAFIQKSCEKIFSVFKLLRVKSGFRNHQLLCQSTLSIAMILNSSKSDNLHADLNKGN